MRPSPVRGLGFSIVELLVVIVVIAVLLAVLLPALAGASRSAKMSVSVSNLRQIGVIFDLYAQGERAYPVATRDEFGDVRLYPFACGDGTRIAVPHWQAIRSWPAIVDPYAPWSDFGEVFLSPSAERESASCGWPTSYYYSSSFLARPETWMPGTEPEDHLLSGTTPELVVFSSRKAMAWDTELPFLRGTLPTVGPDIARRVPILFADGHVAMHAPSEASEPTRNVFEPGMVDDSRLHNTASGVRGIDY